MLGHVYTVGLMLTVTLMYTTDISTTQEVQTDFNQRHFYRQRKFFGMSRSDLHKLNLKHEKTLKRLKKASNYVQDKDDYKNSTDIFIKKRTFPWSIVNRTCPEINYTFEYKEPFLHQSLPVCGDVIQPRMFLNTTSVYCEVDPFNLPNNKTDNCTQQAFTNHQIEELVIITHGFLKSISSSTWLHELGNALLKENPKRVILLVGWGHGSGGSPYPDPFYYYQAAANTRYMGVSVAKMLMDIAKTAAILTNKAEAPFRMHCIGHSLGAHICGFVGKNLQIMSHLHLKRISGLDPAGPLFASDVPYPFNFIQISDEARLNKRDAGFVDVIHTDGRARFSFEVIPQYGTMYQLGHVDFFPGSNGEFGWNQPGCWQVQDIGSCSHSRSHDLYLASLTDPCSSFQACKNTTLIPDTCDQVSSEYPKMGYWVSSEKFVGSAFTVLTNGSAPFCNATTNLLQAYQQWKYSLNPVYEYEFSLLRK